MCRSRRPTCAWPRARSSATSTTSPVDKLFAYPAQSNFSGVKHPLEWIELAHERGWDVLLDCAAFVPTSRLDLSRWRPDFVAISFYKMFGYPTGVGALIARRPALERLRRPWFSGGTVVAANVGGDLVVPQSGHALFEDGTVSYLGIPAVEIGLRHIERIGIDTISQRVEALGTWLLEALQRLRHSGGSPAVRIYGPKTWDRRGATIAFNFLHPDGRVVDERFVDLLAAAHGISVRTGCFCNPGAGETAFAVSEDALAGAEFEPGMLLDDYIRLVGVPTGGAVRASLGLATNFADVHRFMSFAAEFCDMTERAVGPAAQAGLLEAGRQSGVRAQRLAQGRHQVGQDHVEERVRLLAVEEPLERLLRQPQQQRALARRRRHRRRAAVDQALVAERLPRAGEADPDAPAAPDDHLLDGAVERQVARARGRALGDERDAGGAADEAAGREQVPQRQRVEAPVVAEPTHVAAVRRRAELELAGRRRRAGCELAAERRREDPDVPAQARAGHAGDPVPEGERRRMPA